MTSTTGKRRTGLKKSKNEGAESSKTNLAVFIPWVLAFATILVGVWKFTAEQGQANKKPFLEKQLELGFQATETAAKLAVTTDVEEWKKARHTFWLLYWGPLSIVEDPKVEQAMVELGKLVPTTDEPVPPLPMSILQHHSYELAHAVRGLLLKSWNIELPDVEAKRN